MRFQISTTYNPAATLGDPDLFIDNHIVDVFVSNPKDYAYDTLVARFAVDRIDMFRVSQAGQSLCKVCNCIPSGWEAIYSKVINISSNPPVLSEDFQDALKIDIRNLILIHRMALHPHVRQLQCYLIDHLAKICPWNSMVMMRENSCELTSTELTDLGFRHAVREKLLFRPNPCRTNYDSHQDDKKAEYFELPADDLVESSWEIEEV